MGVCVFVSIIFFLANLAQTHLFPLEAGHFRPQFPPGQSIIKHEPYLLYICQGIHLLLSTALSKNPQLIIYKRYQITIQANLKLFLQLKSALNKKQL